MRERKKNYNSLNKIRLLSTVSGVTETDMIRVVKCTCFLVNNKVAEDKCRKNGFVIMPPTSKEMRGPIGFGLSVHAWYVVRGALRFAYGQERFEMGF